MNYRKATLGELQDILRDENAGAGVKHMAFKELQRRERGAFKNTPPPMINSEITKWARKKSGISIENNFRVGKLK